MVERGESVRISNPELRNTTNLRFSIINSQSHLHLLALVCAVLCGTAYPAIAQSVPDYAVLLSATVQTNPAQITLSWPADSRATNYTLYRKTRDATSWGTATPLATNATNYTDTSVASGNAFEYWVGKAGWTGTTNYTGDGYIYAGIQVPLA